MQLKILGGMSLLFLFPIGLYAFNFSDLKDLIEKNHITKIDELIPHLPQNYKENYVVMFDSRSPQTATPEKPRIILHGNGALAGHETSELILAFDQTGNDVEVMHLEPPDKTITLQKITFDPSGAPKFFEKNPSECLRCHSDPPRPIWERPPLWPGSQESIKFLPDHQKQRELSERIRHAFQAEPRLQALDKRMISNSNRILGGTYGLFRLTTWFHALEIAKLILPRFNFLRFALVGSYRCESGVDFLNFLPERYRDQKLKKNLILKSFKEFKAENIRTLEAAQSAFVKAGLSQSDLSQLVNLSREPLVDSMNASYKHFILNLSILEHLFGFPAAFFSSSLGFNLGGVENSSVFSGLLKAFLEYNPHDSQLLHTQDLIEKNPLNPQIMCSQLQRWSQQEIQKEVSRKLNHHLAEDHREEGSTHCENPISIADQMNATFSHLQQGLNQRQQRKCHFPKAFENCKSCHSEYQNEESLLKFLHAKPTYWRNILKKIKNGKMPPDKRLSDEEIQEVESFFLGTTK
jgi:Cytochrome C oxidase, cbb3-type, subunit III